MKGRMRLGRPSVGCEGKVSIKAMRPSASPHLTAGLSRADSRSAGWLPCLARRSALPSPHTPSSKPARLGHADTISVVVSLPLTPEILITGIIMIWGLEQVPASPEADGSEPVGAGVGAERGAGSH